MVRELYTCLRCELSPHSESIKTSIEFPFSLSSHYEVTPLGDQGLRDRQWLQHIFKHAWDFDKAAPWHNLVTTIQGKAMNANF